MVHNGAGTQDRGDFLQQKEAKEQKCRIILQKIKKIMPICLFSATYFLFSLSS
tara:strand:- start:24213 stop:24371 length:159 start_codon:yes stop_codon:yes gene_type:complete